MNKAPVLDTHIWIWWMLGDARLKAADRDALDSLAPGNRPVLCDISLWELASLVDLGRLKIRGDLVSWLRIAASPDTVRTQAITPALVGEMNRLPEGFHRDPADRLIVATARLLKLPILSYDRKIRSSRLVPLWKA